MTRSDAAPVAMVPESQLWTLTEPDRSRIERGLAWAAETEAREGDGDLLRLISLHPDRDSAYEK